MTVVEVPIFDGDELVYVKKEVIQKLWKEITYTFGVTGCRVGRVYHDDAGDPNMGGEVVDG